MQDIFVYTYFLPKPCGKTMNHFMQFNLLYSYNYNAVKSGTQSS